MQVGFVGMVGTVLDPCIRCACPFWAYILCMPLKRCLLWPLMCMGLPFGVDISCRVRAGQAGVLDGARGPERLVLPPLAAGWVPDAQAELHKLPMRCCLCCMPADHYHDAAGARSWGLLFRSVHCTLCVARLPKCAWSSILHASSHLPPPGCSLAHWEQASGTAAEAAERTALLAVLDREQQMCEVSCFVQLVHAHGAVRGEVCWLCCTGSSGCARCAADVRGSQLVLLD